MLAARLGLVTVAVAMAGCGPRATTAATSQAPGAPAREAAIPVSDRPWAPREVDGFDPREVIELVTIPAHPWNGDDFGSAHFRDVMSRARPENRFRGSSRLSTVGHETHHMLLAQVANDARTGDAFFYFEGGYGAFVTNSANELVPSHIQDGKQFHRRVHRTNLAMVRDRLPDTARRYAAGRFATYLADEQRGYYGVLYLFDEWNAYLAGGRMSIEFHRAGNFLRANDSAVTAPGSTVRIDAVDGMVDFLWFASVGVLLLSENEPDYLRNNPQLKALYAHFAEETVRLFREGRAVPTFRGFHGEALFDAFATAPDAAALRAFLRSWLGEAWTRRVFGF